MPAEATVEDIRGAYLEGWRLGLKALAIYRDGSKGSQPVSTKSESSESAKDAEAARIAAAPLCGCAGRRRASPGASDRLPAKARAAAPHAPQPHPQI